VTTSSSLGRSSVYNRPKLGRETYFASIGYTQGWGYFHVPDSLFAELRAYLRKRQHKYVDGHRFGQGPNWRLRTALPRSAFRRCRGSLQLHHVGPIAAVDPIDRMEYRDLHHRHHSLFGGRHHPRQSRRRRPYSSRLMVAGKRCDPRHTSQLIAVARIK
jgi:hypothetical protein